MYEDILLGVVAVDEAERKKEIRQTMALLQVRQDQSFPHIDLKILYRKNAVNLPIAALDVEPLDSARDLLGDDLFVDLLISVGGRWIGRVGLRRCRLSLRVGHDGRWSV